MKLENQKSHYKMYKKGKFWIFAGVTLLTLSANTAIAHADTDQNANASDNQENADPAASSLQEPVVPLTSGTTQSEETTKEAPTSAEPQDQQQEESKSGSQEATSEDQGTLKTSAAQNNQSKVQAQRSVANSPVESEGTKTETVTEESDVPAPVSDTNEEKTITSEEPTTQAAPAEQTASLKMAKQARAVKADATIVDSNTLAVDGGSAWTIDSNGVLTISEGNWKDLAKDTTKSWLKSSQWNKVTTVNITGPVVGTGSLVNAFFKQVNFTVKPITSITGLENVNTDNATSFSGMFSGNKITDFTGIEKWNTSNVTSMSNMFSSNQVTDEKLLPVQNWDVSNVTEMDGMFSNMPLTSLDLSNWHPTSLTSVGGMFLSSSKLASVNFDGWQTSTITQAANMFNGTSSLTSLDLSGFDLTALKQAAVVNILLGTTSLKQLTLGDNSRLMVGTNNAGLPEIPVSANYTGKWVAAEKDANGNWVAATKDAAGTSAELMALYSMGSTIPAGTITYIWQEAEPVAAGKVNVQYVDESGKLIATTDEATYPDGQWVGKQYTTTPKNIAGYEFFQVDSSGLAANGTLTADGGTVTYIYRQAAEKVNVEYVDEAGNVIDTGEATYPDGQWVGKQYTTEQKDIDGYEFVRVDSDGLAANGTLTADGGTVKYVYRQAAGKVNVQYVDEAGNVIKTGEADYPDGQWVGQKYTTEQKDLDGYEFVRVDSDGLAADGTLTAKGGTVTYVYRQAAGKVNVQYVDEAGNVIKTGEATYPDGQWVGQKYTTEQKDLDGYEFVRVDSDGLAADGTLTAKGGTVTYVYRQAAGKVNVQYVDEAGNVIKTGEADYPDGQWVGQKYTTEQKDLDGYEFVRVDSKDLDATGTLTAKGGTVTYVYRQAAGKVNVQYVDEAGNVIKTGVATYPDGQWVGQKYTTEQKNLDGYEFVRVDSKGLAANGTLTANGGTVKYIYRAIPATQGTVNINFIDDTTGKTLTTKTQTGAEGAHVDFSTAELIKYYKSLGYVLVSDNYPTDGVTYNDGTQTFSVHLKHEMIAVPAESKTVSQTIHYVYANGQTAAEDHYAKLVFTRQGQRDLVTNEIVWGAWTADATTFNAVTSPVLKGYQADQPTVAAVMDVTAESADQVVTVTYKADAVDPVDPEVPVDPDKPIDPDKPVGPENPGEPDVVDPDKPVDPGTPTVPVTPTLPSQPGTSTQVDQDQVVGTRPGNTGVADATAPIKRATATTPAAAQATGDLPQTNENRQRGVLSLAGVGLLAMLGWFGYRRKS